MFAETIQFDDLDNQKTKKKNSSDSRLKHTATRLINAIPAASETRQTRDSAVKLSSQPLAARTRRTSNSSSKSKAGSSVGKNRPLTHNTDSSEDTEEQVDLSPHVPVSEKKRARTSTSATATGNKVKAHTAHYPQSTYNVSPLTKARATQDHKTILDETIQAICSAEIATLENYFATELPGSTHAKILTHVCDVISELPVQISAQCAPEIVFHPEITKVERNKLDVNRNKLDYLNSSIEKLEHYSLNPEHFMRDVGLLEPKSPGAVNKSGKKNSKAKGSKKVYYYYL